MHTHIHIYIYTDIFIYIYMNVLHIPNVRSPFEGDIRVVFGVIYSRSYMGIYI